MALRKSNVLLPSVFQTDKNEKFLNATVDQLISEPEQVRVNGFIGRKTSPNFVKGDSYLQEINEERQNYQLEPAVVYRNSSNEPQSVSTLIDFLNAIRYNSGDANNQDSLFEQEYYNWDGFIDLDKFVNYGEYFWLPGGPDAVQVFGSTVAAEKDFDVTTGSDNSYDFNGLESNGNPTIYLARGGSYSFNVNQVGTSFWIQTEPGTDGLKNAQNNISTRNILGIENNGEDFGTVTFNVPDADAQTFFTEMPVTANVDLATTLTYAQVQNAVYQTFLDTYGGIDTFTELNGKTLVFLNESDDERDWDQGAPYDAFGYDSATVEGGEGSYDTTTSLSLADRYDVFTINVQNLGGTNTIVLTRSLEFPKATKVRIKQGVNFGNRQVYKRADNKLELVPPITAPNTTYYYQDGETENKFGKIVIVDPEDVETINVQEDILGQVDYTSPNGVVFTNGLKIEFDSSVTDDAYAGNSYYVEGVGTSIKLVKTTDLATPETYTNNVSEGYDTTGYDSGNYDGSFNQPLDKDYIVCNRASPDLSAWARGNRWFHRSVIDATSSYNGFTQPLDETDRAKRPIIEFKSGLRLFNMGWSSLEPVSIIVTNEDDAFSNVQGQIGYSTDGINLTPGLTVLFINDTDEDVRQTVYEVDLIDEDDDVDSDPLIRLIPYQTVSEGDCVVSELGSTQQGKQYYFEDNTWTAAQEKTRTNQAPLFDLFDGQGNSLSDLSVYESSTFTGCKLFSYKINTAAQADPVLNFGVSYKNFNNIGDIVFENNYASDIFSYTKSTGTVDVIAKSGAVHRYDDTGSFTKENGWTKIREHSRQFQTVTYTVGSEKFSFEVGASLTEIDRENLKVFVNSAFQDESKYTVLTQDRKTFVVFDTALEQDDTVVINMYSSSRNPLGYYDVPRNLENNAENDDFESITLGQIRNHYVEIAQNIEQRTGKVLGANNLRDINFETYPGKILQHSAGAIVPMYFLTSGVENAVQAIEYSMNEYGRFKNRFIKSINDLGVDLTDPASAVDEIIEHLVGSKTVAFPFYYTDMVPWGDQKSSLSYTVDDVTELRYELDTQFDLTDLSTRGVLVYRTRGTNQTLLIEGQDYTLAEDEAAVNLTSTFDLAVNDVITIVEYTNTDGSFVPPTPTKMGMYPKHIPEYHLELVHGYTPTTTGPWKIYGIADPTYTSQPSAGSTGFFYPLYTTLADAKAADTALGGSGEAHIHRFVGTNKLFFMPVSDTNHAVQDTDVYDFYPGVKPVVIGHDGSRWVGYGNPTDLVVFEYEKRVFNNIKTQYNSDLFDWTDAQTGFFRSTDAERSRELAILERLYGAWAEKNSVNRLENTTFDVDNSFTWNYGSGADKIEGRLLPGGWRGIYQWFYDTDTPHITPWEMLGLGEKPSWWDDRYGEQPYTAGNTVMWKDLRDGKLYSDATGSTFETLARYKRPNLLDIIPVDAQGNLRAPNDFLAIDAFVTDTNSNWKFGDQGPQESAWRHSPEYPFAVQILGMIKKPAKYGALMFDTNLYEVNTDFDQILQKDKTYRPNLSNYKIHGVLDENGVPNRVEGYSQFLYNYMVFNNYSSKNLQTKLQNLQLNLAYSMGAFTDKNLLRVLAENATPNSSNESIFIPDENYDVFLHKSVPLERVFYSGVKITDLGTGYRVSGYDTANPSFRIVPSAGNSTSRTFTLGNETFSVFDKFNPRIETVPYGTVFKTKQEVVDFFNAYQRYLSSKGIQFIEITDKGNVQDFRNAAKEFVFWTQQNWPVGSVFAASPVFDKLVIDRQFTTTDDFSRSITIRDVNGKPIRPTEYTVDRVDNLTRVKANVQDTGIYSALVSPIQYEHVLLFNNTTIFNDVIYQPNTGNRQERMKLVGFKIGNWNGTLHAPGFFLSRTNADEWQQNRDYKRGDVVQFQNKKYVAKENHTSIKTFEFARWILAENFRAGLLQNPASKAAEFEGFFDVDTLNLEIPTDKAGKGLIGFRNREYLENLGLDDVTQVKFYQNMIRGKGTREVIDKLIKADLTNLDQEIDFFEEWGFRVGEYGSTDSNQVIELIVDESSSKENPIVVELLTNNETADPNRLSVLEKDLYKKPNNYTTSVFGTRTADSEQFDLNTAGYPRLDDIDFTLFDIDDYADLNNRITDLGRGDTVWVARSGTDWDVFRITETANDIVKVETTNNGFLRFTTESNHGLSKDDVIVVRTDADYGGVYKVRSSSDPESFIVASDIDVGTIEDLQVPLLKFTSSRFSKQTDIASFSPLYGWDLNEKIWVDSDLAGSWVVYQKQKPWSTNGALDANSATASGSLGSSLSIGKDTLVAFSGQPEDASGKVITYVLNNSRDFEESVTLSITDFKDTVDGFGASVAVGDDFQAVGAPESNTNRGYVAVYKQTGSGTFTIQQLISPDSLASGAKFGEKVVMSKNDRYLFASATGTNTVYVYALNDLSTAETRSYTFEGDGATQSFGLIFTPQSINSILVQNANGEIYAPYKDFTLSGSTITFTEAPADSLFIVVREQDHYVPIGTLTGSLTTTGDDFGRSIDVDNMARTLIVGAPDADVVEQDTSTLITDAGEAYLFSHIIEDFTADGTSTDYTTATSLTDQIFVEVDGVLQTETTGLEGGDGSSVGFYSLSGDTISFRYTPSEGAIIRVYTGVFVEMQRLTQNITGETLTDSERFGASVAIDPKGAFVAVGAPGEDETNANTGSVFMFADAGLRFGSITTESSDDYSVDAGDTIYINNRKVQISSTSGAVGGLTSDIENANLTLVDTASSGRFLTVNTTSRATNEKLRIRPGSGDSFKTAKFNPFRMVQKINHPSGLENENFGEYVAFDKHIPVNRMPTQNLVVTSTRASTFLRTGFDFEDGEYTTTFDNGGTQFVERITQSGAAYVYEILDDIAESLATPPQYAFMQQLTSTDINEFDQFGSAVSFNDDKILVGANLEDSVTAPETGAVYEFDNPTRGVGWKELRHEVDKVDPELINRVMMYNRRTNVITDFLDYVDPFKSKISGLAQDELDFRTSYDPASYNEGNSWGEKYVGRTWWDLSTVSVIEYEQGDLNYRSTYWGTFFPGSSIDVYEWVQSDVPPSEYDGPGTPKNTNMFTTVQTYVPLSDTSETRYYFWVSDRADVPNLDFRKISINRVKNLIENPKGAGLKYAQIMSPSSIGLMNVQSALEDRNAVLSVNYDVIKNEGVLHSEFELVAENDEAQAIPDRLFNKIIDSLAGQDSTGNPVPDPTLSRHQKFGVSIRPRQGLFANRLGALKVFVSYSNKEFEKFPVIRQANLTNLLNAEDEPTAVSGEWNKRVASVTERDYLALPTLGAGYRVLVASDDTQSGRWTIYELDANQNWSLYRIQSYDTSEFWNYKTWYADGFDQFTIPLYQVDTEADLLTIDDVAVGEVAKVLSNDDGNFSFFEYQSDGTWEEVIIENGTIEFSESLYTEENLFYSYDSAGYDFSRYDSVPVTEIRNLLTAIRDDIFITPNALQFNKLFFRLIEFALHEQEDIIGHPDWVLKTSFIRVLHKLRNLSQYPTFRNDNSEFIEKFIEEVKPYKTNIREYIASFDGNDVFEGDTTDFDLHAFFDNDLGYFRKPSGDFAGDEITRTQGLNKPWSDNYTYSIGEIVIYNAGSGFLVDPTITISAPDVSSGTQATARAVTNGDNITSVIVTNAGSGYTTIPTITVDGSGTGLRLIPRLTNGTNREFTVTMKFDRITYSSVVQTWEANTAYSEDDLIVYVSSDGSQEIYQAQLDFTSGSSFSTEDSSGNTALIVYEDADIDNNADRIAAYYNPATGMLGDTLALVQKGTEYPGVKVQGAGFDQEPGYDQANYDVVPYDNFEVDLDGLTVLGGANSLDTVIRSQYTDASLGTRPEDIDIHGGGFVDTYSSHAPEEFVPGIVFDTLDMSVFTAPSSDYEWNGNSFQINLLSYTADGSTATYSYASGDSVEDLDNIYVWVGQTAQRNFTVDHAARTVTLGTVPAENSSVYVYSYGNTGEKMTVEQTFIGDGSTTDFLLEVNEDQLKQQLILLNGAKQTEGVDYTLEAVNSRVQLKFTTAPANNDHIHAFGFNVDPSRKAFTEVHTQEITLTEGQNTYDLDKSVQYIEPLTGNVIAELDSTRLRPTNAKHYAADGSTTVFAVPDTAGETASNVSDGDITVSVIPATRPTELNPDVNKVRNIDYTITPSDGSSTRTIEFFTAPEEGAVVIVAVDTGAQYLVDENSITLTSATTFFTGDKLYVTSFANHDPLRIQTKVFEGLGSEIVRIESGYDEEGYDTTAYDETTTTGIGVARYTLDRTPTNLTYLWVTLNGVKLHPGQYRINEEGQLDLEGNSITDSSVIVVTSFDEDTIQPTIGFRIFENMLGDVEYIRISKDFTTKLAQKLEPTDTTIYLEDASVLPATDPDARYPGAVFIGNERVTYWEIDYDNNTLSNIRRGTGGTRYATEHAVGTTVCDGSRQNYLPQTNTHTKVWYDQGTGTAANGLGLQASTTENAIFLKASEAEIKTE